MQPHRHRLRQIGFADDDGNRRAAHPVAEDHETGREAAMQRDRRLGGDGQRRDRVLAELRDRVGGHHHQRRIACDHARRHAVADQQRRQPLGELGKLDRGAGGLAGGDLVEVPRDLGVGGKRQDRRRVVKIADCEAVGPAPSSPSARARRAVIRRCGRPGAQTSLKEAKPWSVMPSTGRATAASPPALMMTGRPDRNSASARSTATCLGLPNRSDFPFPLMSPRTHPLGPLPGPLGLTRLI